MCQSGGLVFRLGEFMSFSRAGRMAVVVLAGALALSACGGDSESTDASASPTGALGDSG